MIKSMSMMKNVVEICSLLRAKYFGEAATVKDYRDSFVINHAIEGFKESPEQLLLDVINEKDRSNIKTSKSLNFRMDVYERICTISKLLEIPEAEVVRRILYYCIENKDSTADDYHVLQMTALKEKVVLLQKQVDDARNTIMNIMSLVEEYEKESTKLK